MSGKSVPGGEGGGGRGGGAEGGGGRGGGAEGGGGRGGGAGGAEAGGDWSMTAHDIGHVNLVGTLFITC